MVGIRMSCDCVNLDIVCTIFHQAVTAFCQMLKDHKSDSSSKRAMRYSKVTTRNGGMRKEESGMDRQRQMAMTIVEQSIIVHTLCRFRRVSSELSSPPGKSVM
jgi:hypothetical protein